MSETINLKLKKHDNVSINTDEFDIENYINANWDKIDTKIGQVEDNTTSNAENIEELKNKDNKQEEKIEQMEETYNLQEAELEELRTENERLRQDLNSSVVTSEESGENITLADSPDCRFKRFEIGGNSKQETRSGKNKLKCDAGNKSLNGTTLTRNSNGSYTVTGTTTGTSTYYLSTNRMEITKKSIGSGKNNLVGMGLGVQYYKNGETSLTYSNLEGTVFEAGDAIDRVYLQQQNTNINVSGTVYPQIEEGEIATDYEQYGAMPSIEFPSDIKTVKDNVNIVVCNKNWFVKTKLLQGGWNSTNANRVIFGMQTEIGEKYTVTNLSSNYEISVFETLNLLQSTTNNKVYNDLGNVPVGESKTITISEGKYLRVQMRKNDNSVILIDDILPSDVQIESGDISTNYEEHKEQTFTMPIQQEMLEGDYFDLKNNKEVHNSSKVVFDGSSYENWIWSNNSDNYIGFIIDMNVDSAGILYCDKFKAKKIEEINGIDVQGIALRGNNKGFYIRIKRELLETQSVTGFKSFLTQNNLTVRCSSLNANEIAFTEEQKTIAKQIIDTVHSYKGVTHIYTTDETKAILNVEYIKDLNTIINNLQAQILAE